MERVLAIVATLAAGALVAFQPPANASLAKHTGALGATLISLTVSVVIIAGIMVFAGGFGSLRGVTSMEPVHLLGGIAGAAIVGVSLVTVTTLGAGGVVAATVTTQLIVSALLDRLGVLGLDQLELTPARLAGFGLLVVGTFLVTLA